MKLHCNICGSNKFKSFGVVPRNNAQCFNCESLERHRILKFFLENNGYLKNVNKSLRCLQLAPEKVTHDYLSKAFGSGYITADINPKKYEYAKCLKLNLPQDFSIFPDNYFDLIIHNHVLEHIPGSYKDHINEFYRLISFNGAMVFTVPFLKTKKITIEGGEFLLNDETRLRIHGQKDHYKTFGTDLFDYLKIKFSKFKIMYMENNELTQKLRKEHNAWGSILWCIK